MCIKTLTGYLCFSLLAVRHGDHSRCIADSGSCTAHSGSHAVWFTSRLLLHAVALHPGAEPQNHSVYFRRYPLRSRPLLVHQNHTASQATMRGEITALSSFYLKSRRQSGLALPRQEAAPVRSKSVRSASLRFHHDTPHVNPHPRGNLSSRENPFCLPAPRDFRPKRHRAITSGDSHCPQGVLL